MNSEQLNTLVLFYNNAFKLNHDYQALLTNMQYETMGKLQQSTGQLNHLDMLKSQMDSNIDQLDSILSQQSKILETMNEISKSFIMEQEGVHQSNVYIYGTRNAPSSSSSTTTTSRNVEVRNDIFSNIPNPINNQCPISFEQFSDNSEVSIITSCGHIFTRNSLTNWLNINPVCPLCRTTARNTSTTNNRNIRSTISTLTQTMLNRFLNNESLIDISGGTLHFDIDSI